MIKTIGIVATLLASTTAALLMSATARAGTIASGVLLVGSDQTYPPYDYVDGDNKPAGFDVEFMTAIAKAAGLTAKFLDSRFENLIIGVGGDKFDVIASTLYVKPARAQQIDFIPYMKTGVSIAVSANAKRKPVSPEDLCGLKVSSIKSAAWIANLQEVSQTTCATKGLGQIDVREFPTSPEATQAVLSGGVDAQMEDSAVLKQAVTATNGKIVISSTSTLYPVIVGLGFKKGNADVKKTVTDAFEKIKANGEYDALLAKYNVSGATDGEFKQAVSGTN
ncbi:ABC transporter substrate-binding protein [Bradyrhizobium sp. LTSP885]|uniref:ABC transporter substrate-binding protein n=1 Tax=Bradyrhizobium sp. LTSP885 TaxID=1619232 RepID=UPI00069A27B3|nr:ABC transporter substrate-binding protein [Bradyrhizobium sp. LTSP885]